MVVCKCRKATKLYCFVHKVPVCGECICFQEHQICVINTYSEWVIDADYDWPPKCSSCNETLQEGADPVIRLGCLHVLHSSCLVSYLQNFPPNTTPAGYACPLCSDSIWPPKSIRDPNSAFSSRLKDIITQSGLSKQLLGSDATASLRQSTLPPVTSSDLSAFLASSSVSASLGVNNGSTPSEIGLSILGTSNLGNPSSNGANESVPSSSQIAVDIDSYTSNSDEAFTPFLKASPLVTPGAMTRIKPSRGGKLGANEDDEDDDDDDDGASRKYNRRGPFHKKFLRFLIPFWSTSLPTLPVTATQRKDERERDPSVTEELIEGRPRRRQRSSSSSFDPTKVLLLFAVLSCIATALLLYYRLAQGSDKQGLQQIEEQ